MGRSNGINKRCIVGNDKQKQTMCEVCGEMGRLILTSLIALAAVRATADAASSYVGGHGLVVVER